nr:hypothetical protein [Tanacetum cinerariifolium]
RAPRRCRAGRRNAGVSVGAASRAARWRPALREFPAACRLFSGARCFGRQRAGISEVQGNLAGRRPHRPSSVKRPRHRQAERSDDRVEALTVFGQHLIATLHVADLGGHDRAAAVGVALSRLNQR